MKTIKQLLRQPLKTAIGIIIVALAFAILVTCVGQYTATDLSRENLDDRYTTIGLLSNTYFWSENKSGRRSYSSHLPEDIQQWIEILIWNRTDLVKSVSSTGLISAYIPDLNIDHFSKYKYGYKMSEYNKGYPYRCAMLTVTLNEIGTVGTENIHTLTSSAGKQDLVYDTTFLCTGTIKSVVGLGKGFLSPVGKTIVLHITVSDQTAFDALNLQVGQTYLVYGEDYSCADRGTSLDLLINHRESYQELFGSLSMKGGMINYDPILEKFDCTLTLCDPTSLPTYLPAYDENRTMTGYEISEDRHEVWYWSGETNKKKWLSTEEFIASYKIPTIIPLNSTVEDFLESDEGAIWQEKLDEMEINNHSFPVLGVEKLGYQALFSREQARIVEGRDFSESELVNGKKVCIISQTVATKSGVQVGDTIELRTYTCDPTYEVQRREMLMGISFPSAAIYSKALGFSSETESYTIVGLYRQEDAWQNRYDSYGFTPNTIFVPKASVSAEMITREKGIYSTLVLHNGKMDEFKSLMEEAGYPDLFICYDQGYSEFMASLDAYENVSEKALYIGLAAYAAIILLFLFLYPTQQKRSLRLMGALGASAWGRFRHTFISVLCVLVPGAALGGYVGSKLWTRIAAALMEWINIEIALESDMTAIAPRLTAVGIAAVGALALVVCAALSRNRGLMKRR